MPAILRPLLDRRERGWVRAADAHTAVNDALADRAVARWGLAPPPDGRAQLPGAADDRRPARPARPDPRGDRPAADDPDLPVLGPPRAVRRTGRGRRGRPRGAGRGPRRAGVRTRLGRERRPRRRPALRRSPLHAAGRPPRRAPRVGRVRGRGAVHAAAVVVQPAPCDAEQVPRGDGGRHADRARSRPARDAGDARARRPRPRGRSRWHPADIAAAIRVDPRPARRRAAAWRERIATTARATSTWPVAAAAYRALVDEVRAR